MVQVSNSNSLDRFKNKIDDREQENYEIRKDTDKVET
jgi:hypothetical protein